VIEDVNYRSEGKKTGLRANLKTVLGKIKKRGKEGRRLFGAGGC